MTKAEHIMLLYDGKRPTGEIAAIVGCMPEYVRVVARQRQNGKGATEADRKWWAAKGSAHRRNKYATDPKYRARVRAVNRRCYLKRRQRESSHV